MNFTSIPQEITAPYFFKYFVDQLDNAGTFIKSAESLSISYSKCAIQFKSVEVWNLTGRAVSLTVWEPPAQDYKFRK